VNNKELMEAMWGAAFYNPEGTPEVTNLAPTAAGGLVTGIHVSEDGKLWILFQDRERNS
jgi:hypothetical protein